MGGGGLDTDGLLSTFTSGSRPGCAQTLMRLPCMEMPFIVSTAYLAARGSSKITKPSPVGMPCKVSTFAP